MKIKLLSLATAMIMVLSLFQVSVIQTVFAEPENTLGNTGKTYYVDSDGGSDTASGLSESEAWQSLDMVNGTTFEPGDAVLLKRGSVWTDTFLWPKGAGDAENQNYISCYGDEEDDIPSITSLFSDDVAGLPNADTCVYLGTNQNYWTIEKLDLTNGTNSTGSQSAVYFTSSSSNRMKGVILRDCVINGSNPANWSNSSKSGLAGISVSGFIDNVLIENNEVYNCKATGITVNGKSAGANYKGQPNSTAGRGVVIRNNYLENIGKDGIITNNCLDPLVEYNVVNKSHSYAGYTAHVALWPFACYGALYQYNEAYNTKTIYDGQGFDCDYLCYNTTFQYNYSHNNTGGFMLICTEASASWMNPQYAFNVGSTVRYNISQNDSHYIFSLIDGIQQTRIYNNTIYSGRNTSNATHLFWAYDKGQNKLTKLRYPDDIMVANNLFYLDLSSVNGIGKSTNIVWKNNLVAGKNRNVGPADGTVTYATESSGNPMYDENGDIRYHYKEVSGNILNTNPLLVAPGTATIGRDTCGGYMLYKDSPAIGNGVYIEDGYHACPNDFFGNPINRNSVNIGAYSGTGLDRPIHTYDEKYEKMVDFEADTVGNVGTGTNGVPLSGIDRCTQADLSAVITDEPTVQNTSTNSTKSLALSNNTAASGTAGAKFYIYASELKKSNGIRVWLDPNGTKTTFTAYFITSANTTYSKSISVKTAGWYCFPFNEKYNGSNNQRVDVAEMRTTKEIKISATLAAGRTVYIDDIQSNDGEMDTIETVVINNEPATLNTVVDFESETIKEYGGGGNPYGGPSSGPTGKTGIGNNGDSKAWYALSHSGASTSVAHYFSWGTGFTAIRDAIAADPNVEGLQWDMRTTGSFSYLSDYSQKDLEPNIKMSVFTPGIEDKYAEYTIKNVAAGTYSLALNTRDYTDRGIYNVSVNSTSMGNIDFTADETKMVTHDAGSFTLAEDGDVTVRLTSVNTGGYYLGTFVLTPQSGDPVTYNAIECSPTSATVYLNDEMKYLANSSFGKYTIKFGSSNKIEYTTEGGAVQSIATLQLASKTADQNNIFRAGFDEMYFTYKENSTNYTVYLTDLTEEQQLAWLSGLSTISISYTTSGKVLGRNITQRYYIDNISTFKDVQHEASDWRTVKEATCTENGENQIVCDYCEKVIQSEVIQAPGHVNSDWNMVKEATCTEEGEEQIICTVCEEIVESKVIDATGHTLENTVVAPTCTEDGYTASCCEVCDYEENKHDEVPATGHLHTEWVSDTPATCTEDGEIHEVCNDCNATLQTAFEKAGHRFEISIIKSNCDEKGHTLHKCALCDYQYTTDETDEIQHIPSEYVTTKFATCTTDGVRVKYCTLCGELVESEAVTASGHTPGDWIVIKDATATASGQRIKRCTVCGERTDLQNFDINSPAAGTVAPSAPVLSSAKVNASSVTLTWGTAENANKYQVLRATSGSNSFVLLGEVSGLTYTDKNVAIGDYVYKVRAFNGTKFTDSNKVNAKVSATVTQSKITLKKPVVKLKAAKKKLTVSFKKVTNAKKYQVQYRAKGTSKWKTKTISKVKVVLKKLKGGKKYQVRVRAAATQNGKTIYSSYSKVKTAKVKK